MAMKKRNLVLGVIFAAIIILACDRKKGLLPVVVPVVSGTPCDTVKYSAHIQPILTSNCATTFCHDGTQTAVLTSYAGTKASVNDVSVNGFVSRAIALHNMPAPLGLPQSQINLIKCWVDAGAKNN